MDEQSTTFCIDPGDILVIEADHDDANEAEKLAKRLREIFGIEKVLIVQPGARIRVLRVGADE